MTNESFQPQAARLHAAVEHPGTLYALCHDPAAHRLYGAGDDGAIYVVDVSIDKPPAEKLATHHNNYVSSLVQVGELLISGGYDRKLIWTNAATGEQVRSVDAHDGWVRAVVLLPDGERLATVGDDMLVKLWDAHTGELVRTFDGHPRQTPEGYTTALYAVAVSGDGQTLASGDRSGEVVLWEVDTGRQIGRLNAATFYTFDARQRARAIGGVRALAFSPDGGRLAIGGIGRVTNVDGFVGPCRVEAWDWRAGERVFVGQDAHKAILNHVAFHPSGKWLIGGGGGDSGGVLAVWDLESEQPRHKAKPKGHIQQFAFDPQTPQILAVGYGGFQLWRFDEPSNSGDQKQG